jgi:hypothetical protein
MDFDKRYLNCALIEKQLYYGADKLRQLEYLINSGGGKRFSSTPLEAVAYKYWYPYDISCHKSNDGFPVIEEYIRNVESFEYVLNCKSERLDISFDADEVILLKRVLDKQIYSDLYKQDGLGDANQYYMIRKRLRDIGKTFNMEIED